MFIFGHIALGYLVSLLSTKLLSISSDSQYYNILLIMGIIASIIPDLDFIALFSKYKTLKLQKDDTHRKYLTHLPLFWISISLLIFIVGLITSINLITYSSLFILAGSLSHLLGDSIEYGIRWFWPISNKQYIMHKIPKENFKESEPLASYYWKFFSQIYVKNWTFYVESVIIIFVLIIIL